MNEMDMLITGRLPMYKIDDDYTQTLARPKGLYFRVTHGWSHEQRDDCIAACRETYDVFQSTLYGEDSGEYIDFDDLPQGDALMWAFMTLCFVYPPDWFNMKEIEMFVAVYGDQNGPAILTNYAKGESPPRGQWFIWRDKYWWLDTERDKLQPAHAAMIPHMPEARGVAVMQPLPDQNKEGG